MRYHVIGSPAQVKAFSAAGVQGSAVSSSAGACSALEEVLKDRSVGTVLLSSLYYDDPSVSEVMEKHDRKGVLPVIMKLEES